MPIIGVGGGSFASPESLRRKAIEASMVWSGNGMDLGFRV